MKKKLLFLLFSLYLMMFGTQVNAASNLPATGESGNFWIIIIAVVILLLAAFLLLRGRKK